MTNEEKKFSSFVMVQYSLPAYNVITKQIQGGITMNFKKTILTLATGITLILNILNFIGITGDSNDADDKSDNYSISVYSDDIYFDSNGHK